MKRNRVFRLLASLTVVVLCMTAFSVTAFAGGGDGDYYTGESAETTPEPTEEPATGGMEPEGQPLTPEGNATLVDDYYGDKQLITVTTKAGNYFYILIDRANEDKETAVHFLNQVDEADLMALLEDGQTEEKPAACTCTEKCQAGAVNTACPVCAVNMSECAGKAPEVEPEPEPEPEKESGSGGALVLILLLAALGGGGAFAYIKFIKPKQGAKVSADPDDYEFEDEESRQWRRSWCGNTPTFPRMGKSCSSRRKRRWASAPAAASRSMKARRISPVRTGPASLSCGRMTVSGPAAARK